MVQYNKISLTDLLKLDCNKILFIDLKIHGNNMSIIDLQSQCEMSSIDL